MPPKRTASKGVSEITKRLRRREAEPELSADMEERIINKIMGQVAAVVRDTIREEGRTENQSPESTDPPTPATPGPVASASLAPPVAASLPNSTTSGESASLMVQQSLSSTVNQLTGIGHTAQGNPPIGMGILPMGPAGPAPPLQSISTPVASLVSDKIRSKIWSNEFITFSQLIDNADRDESYSLRVDQAEGVPTLRWCAAESRARLSMNQWLTAWNRFAAIYLQQFPQNANGLAKHFETVRQISAKHGDWHLYDLSYRREISAGRVSWGHPHLELYLDALTSKDIAAPQQFRTSHNASDKMGAGKLPKGVCFKYHSGQGCSKGGSCKFQHSCFNCSKLHPISQCPFPVKRPFRIHSRFGGSAESSAANSSPGQYKMSAGKTNPTSRPNFPPNPSQK